MTSVGIHARNQSVGKHPCLSGGLGRSVFDAVYAFTITELTAIEPSTAAGAVRKPLGAGLRANVQGVCKAARTAGIAPDQRPFYPPLQPMEPDLATRRSPEVAREQPAEPFAQRVVTAEQQ